MSKKSNNLRNNILLIIGMFVIAFLLFIMLEKDKAKRVEKQFLSFQTEYKEYLDKDSSFNNETIERLTKSSLFSGTTLAEYYDDIKSNTFKKIEKEYLEQLYIFNFLKNENINSYSKENKEKFQKIISTSNELSIKFEEEHNIRILESIKDNNDALKEIAKNELKNDMEIIDKYEDALANKKTKNTILNKCFKTQENLEWKYNKELSRLFCERLGLNNCQAAPTTNSKETNIGEQFYGYTLNNPKSISDDKPYIDYVSYRNDDFRVNSKEIFKKYENDNYVYSEVYEQEVSGRKIYKYNVVIISKDYNLSCKTPS